VVYLESDEHEFNLRGSEELTLAIIHQQQASRTSCHSTAQEKNSPFIDTCVRNRSAVSCK